MASYPRVFDAFSLRAKMVVFVARYKAGKNGAHAIGLDHILQGIIIEDQGRDAMLKFLGDDPATTQLRGYDKNSLPPLFLLPEVASALLTKIDKLSPHAKSAPASQEMSLTADAVRAVQAAPILAHEFGSDKVDPLYLLAAALRERSSKAVQICSEYAITEDKIVEELSRLKIRDEAIS